MKNCICYDLRAALSQVPLNLLLNETKPLPFLDLTNTYTLPTVSVTRYSRVLVASCYNIIWDTDEPRKFQILYVRCATCCVTYTAVHRGTQSVFGYSPWAAAPDHLMINTLDPAARDPNTIEAMPIRTTSPPVLAVDERWPRSYHQDRSPRLGLGRAHQPQQSRDPRRGQGAQ